MKAKMFTSWIILRKPRNAPNQNAIAHAFAKEEKEAMVEAVMVVVVMVVVVMVVVVTAMIIIMAMIITAVAVVVVDPQDLDIKPCTEHTRTKLYSGLIFLFLMLVLCVKMPIVLCSRMQLIYLMVRIRV